MEVSATLKNLRIAPRKVRLIAGAIRGLDVSMAKSQLEHLIKKSARPLSKLLDSAVANARNNLGLVKENLFIKDIIVNEGIKLKRFRPKGFGTASPIQKKTSAVKIILEEKVPGLKAALPEKKEKEGAAEKEIEAPVPEKETKAEVREKAKPEVHPVKPARGGAAKQQFDRVKKEIGKKPGLFGRITRRFFRRKAI